jgi:hypothetical protein
MEQERAMAVGEISGFHHRRKGVKKREVCSADIRSVDPRNISAIQRKTGSQVWAISRKLKFAV